MFILIRICHRRDELVWMLVSHNPSHSRLCVLIYICFSLFYCVVFSLSIFPLESGFSSIAYVPLSQCVCRVIGFEVVFHETTFQFTTFVIRKIFSSLVIFNFLFPLFVDEIWREDKEMRGFFH